MMGAKVVMMIVNVEISVTSNDDKESKNLKVYLGKRDQNQGSWKLEHWNNFLGLKMSHPRKEFKSHNIYWIFSRGWEVSSQTSCRPIEQNHGLHSQGGKLFHDQRSYQQLVVNLFDHHKISYLICCKFKPIHECPKTNHFAAFHRIHPGKVSNIRVMDMWKWKCIPLQIREDPKKIKDLQWGIVLWLVETWSLEKVRNR